MNQILQRATLLRGEVERRLIAGEGVEERGFSNAPTTVDHRHLKPVLRIHAIELGKPLFASNEHTLTTFFNIRCLRV